MQDHLYRGLCVRVCKQRNFNAWQTISRERVREQSYNVVTFFAQRYTSLALPHKHISHSVVYQVFQPIVERERKRDWLSKAKTFGFVVWTDFNCLDSSFVVRKVPESIPQCLCLPESFWVLLAQEGRQTKSRDKWDFASFTRLSINTHLFPDGHYSYEKR